MASSTPTQQAAAWLGQFATCLAARDIAGAAALFGDECHWRDLVAFTWNIHTAEGRPAVAGMLGETLARTQPSHWRIEGEATASGETVEAWITFETGVARCNGHLRLRGGKAFTLLTSMVELKGFEEKKGVTRAAGAEHGVHRDRKTWAELRAQEEAELGVTTQPFCLIVGGGQGGIALGARLRRLGVPTIIVEKNARAGDSWRNRYKSLCLHDPVWYDHLPYLPFPDDWPVFSPKDKLGDWLEAYTKLMELNYWGSTECKSAAYDATKGEWSVEVVRAGKPVTLRPRQLVFATGSSGFPNVPAISGAETFKGAIYHSSSHPGGAAWRGKMAVVVGSNNSAHDICADLWEHGADVTMLQRSSTHVSRSDSLMELGLGPLYSEEAVANGIDVDKADLIGASVPYALMAAVQKPVSDAIRKRDADFLARLEKSGFMLDFGDDDTGLTMKFLRRGSGYYIDVGASDLIIDGSIKLKTRVHPVEIKPQSVVLSDGSELPADLVVLATGYGSMNGWAAMLISQDVADKIGLCWGLGSGTTKDPGPWQGELRNMWKPLQQEALWLHGGNLHQSRHYSQYLSLQLKARHVGIATPVFALAAVHHKG